MHDLTNRKSQINLQKWLSEILNQDSSNPIPHVDVDPEQFLGSTQVTIYVVYVQALKRYFALNLDTNYTTLPTVSPRCRRGRACVFR